MIFFFSQVDYPVSIWAAFRLGAVVTAANPAYNASELAYQFEIVNKFNKIKVVLVHPDSLLEAVEAVRKTGLPPSSIVLIRAPDDTTDAKAAEAAKKYQTLDSLVAQAQSRELPKKRTMSDAESKKATAFYIFSSGTTGLPKAVQIPHYSLVSNV